MKRLLTIMFLILTSTVSGQTKGSLTFFQPSDLVATVRYYGDIVDGKANGYGEAQFFKNGTPDGSYKGFWKDNDCHGKGEYIASSGDKYEGDWLNGVPNGRGTYLFTNGDKYEGAYRDGQPNGRGIKVWVSGAYYDGNWSEGKMHGKGLFIWANGGSYNGDWLNDRKYGKGIHIMPFGDVYDGYWVNDQRAGKGMYYWSNGDLYDGEWSENQFHGYGRYVAVNGNRDEGQYVKNKFLGTSLTQSPMRAETQAAIRNLLENALIEIDYNKGLVAYKTKKYGDAKNWLKKAVDKGHEEAKTALILLNAELILSTQAPQ